MTDLASVTHEFFDQYVGKSFRVRVGEESLELSLAEVIMLPLPKRRTLTGKLVDHATKRLPFSVILHGEESRCLNQGTYEVEPPDGQETLPIFMVPLGVENGAVIYEAIFS